MRWSKSYWEALALAYAYSEQPLPQFHASAVAVLAGPVPSLAAARDHSQHDDWQGLRSRVQAERTTRLAGALLDDAEVRDLSHMQLGQALLGLAREAVEQLALRPEAISAADAIRMVETGVKIQRLVAGQATSREEIAIGLLQPVVDATGAAFSAAMRAMGDEYAVYHGDNPTVRNFAERAAAAVFVRRMDGAVDEAAVSIGLPRLATEGAQRR